MDELVVVVVVLGHRDADRGGWWTSTKARSWRGSHRIQEGQTHNFQVLHFSNMLHALHIQFDIPKPAYVTTYKPFQKWMKRYFDIFLRAQSFPRTIL